MFHSEVEFEVLGSIPHTSINTQIKSLFKVRTVENLEVLSAVCAFVGLFIFKMKASPASFQP